MTLTGGSLTGVSLDFSEPLPKNLGQLLRNWAKNQPEKILYSRFTLSGWEKVTAMQMDQLVRSCAKGLLALGIKPGDRVAIMSKTRFEWTVLDYAIFYAGAITVPIYETSSGSQMEWILSDSESKILFVENSTLYELAREINLAKVEQTLVIEEKVIEQLTQLGNSISENNLEKAMVSQGGTDIATLIYTSGTTGRPKGVEITHYNFLYEGRTVVSAVEDIFLDPKSSILLFLPLAHVFGRMIEIGALYAGCHLAHAPNIANLTNDLKSFKPTFLLAVPRIFEKVYGAAQEKAIAGGKGKIFEKAAQVAIEYSKETEKGDKPSFKTNLFHKIFTKLVYQKIMEGLGGKVNAAISGGAPLDPKLGHFYRGLGIRILEGYGLTETTAGAALNKTNAFRIGSVGRPLQGIEMKIDSTGELHIKGGIIMRGYWKNEAATREVMDSEGYFATGDLAAFDGDGYLYITGRKKEIIVTSGGKNVSPAPLEEALRIDPLISNALVIGDKKPFIAALITLDEAALKRWVVENKKEDSTFEMLIKDQQLISDLQKVVEKANTQVSRAESIRKFLILPKDFSIEGDELTAKLSIKRHVVIEKYQKEIDSIYLTS